MKWWIILILSLFIVGFALAMSGCEGCEKEEPTRPVDDDGGDDDDDDDDDDTIPPGSIVDTQGPVGKYCSLEIDSDTHFYISYHHKDQGLKFAWHDGTNWTIEVVDPGQNVGLYTSLKLRGGKLYISYYAQGKLKLATKDEADWTIEVVDASADDVGKYSKLQLDENDNPLIAYYDATNADVKLARFDGTAWQIETVDSDGDVGRFVELAYWQPFIFLFYYDFTNGDLKMAYKGEAGSWQIKSIYTDGDVGTWPSACVSPMGHIHLAFQDEGRQNLIYGYLDDVTTNWQFEKVDTEGFVGANANMLLKEGKPLIIYQDQDNCDVKQSIRSAKGWSRSAILSDGPFGFWMSAELDRADQVHFCHFYVVKEDLLIWPPIEE